MTHLKTLFIFLIVSSFSITVKSQTNSTVTDSSETKYKVTDVILKVRPLAAFLVRNPGIEVETIINDKFSLALEGIWVRTEFGASGGEAGFNFYPSTGLRVGLMPRFYFTRKHTAPRAWYISGIYRYSNVKIKNKARLEFHGDTIGYINQQNIINEFGLLVGRQMQYWRITSDINIGYGIQNYKGITKVISGDIKAGTGKDVTPKIYLLWTLGYNFPVNNKKKSRN